MNKDLMISAFWISLVLGVAIHGCATNQSKTDSVKAPSVDKVTPSDPPYSGVVTFIPESNEKEEIMMVTAATDKVNKTIKSKCFQDFILKRDMIQTNGQSNEQVLRTILSAKGTIKVKFYKKWRSTEIAVRYAPSTDINFNRSYWTGITDTCHWASTLAHEGIGHVLGGYDHDFLYNAKRDFSVPYSINKAFDACCE